MQEVADVLQECKVENPIEVPIEQILSVILEKAIANGKKVTQEDLLFDLDAYILRVRLHEYNLENEMQLQRTRRSQSTIPIRQAFDEKKTPRTRQKKVSKSPSQVIQVAPKTVNMSLWESAKQKAKAQDFSSYPIWHLLGMKRNKVSAISVK
jgi:hypothetical protein